VGNTSAQTWQTLSIVFFSVGGILFLVAVFTFFRFDVLAAIGELSGRTAAKQIKKLAHTSPSISGGGSASPITYSFKSQRLGVTAKISNQRPGVAALKAADTSSVNSTNPYAAGSFVASNETELLGVNSDHSNVTTLLSADPAITENNIVKSESVFGPADMTTLLSPEEVDTSNMTTILSQNESFTGDNQVTSSAFRITRSILEVHTQERIQ